MRRSALALSLIMGLSPSTRAWEYIPLYNFSILGGQYFFRQDKSSLNGNASAQVAPVLRYDEEWTLLPVYQGSYRGTKSVTDGVGSSSFFQQAMDQRASLSGLYTPEDSPWRLKPSASYKHAFLKETRDEAWGKGLFDYQNFGTGFEAENVYKEPFSYRLGYDFFYTRFLNYNSLESQAGVDPAGNRLGRETAGTHVLDTMNHQVSVSVTRPYPYDKPALSLSGYYRLLWSDFTDQPVINLAGQPTAQGRQDFLHSLGASVGWPKSFRARGQAYRLGTGFSTSFAYNGSNQNTFDAGQTQFVSDSYSYLSFSAGPNASLSWGDDKTPVTLGLGVTWSRTMYLGRLAQASNGVYLGEKQSQDRTLVSLNYGYPIARNFRLNAQTNVLFASSNMKFEQTYRYNYTTANYLFGFTYDY